MRIVLVDSKDESKNVCRRSAVADADGRRNSHRTGTGSKPTQGDVEQHVNKLLAKPTLDEKLEVLGGDRFYIHALPSISMPAIKMSDGPYGVRTFGSSTAYTAGVSLAAAWDPEMAELVGRSMARDARARGVGIILAPGVNIYPLSTQWTELRVLWRRPVSRIANGGWFH